MALNAAAAGQTTWVRPDNDISGLDGNEVNTTQARGTKTMSNDRQGSINEMFQRVRARLRAAIGEDSFNSWFTRLELWTAFGNSRLTNDK